MRPCLLALLLAAPAAANEWTIQTVDRGDAAFTALVVDGFDDVHVAYDDGLTHTVQHATTSPGINIFVLPESCFDCSGCGGESSDAAMLPLVALVVTSRRRRRARRS